MSGIYRQRHFGGPILDLCSIAIAVKGEIVGYNFEKFVVGQALPDKMVCAAVIAPDRGACLNTGCAIKLADKCKHLSSVPIAPRGKIAGFNFDGRQLGKVPMKPVHYGTLFVTQEEEACRRSKEKIIETDTCNILHSIMILP